MKKKLLALILAGACTISLLAGCGGGGGTAKEEGGAAAEGGEGFGITVTVASEPQTIDPQLNTSMDGSIMAQHFFEGLMKWENNGKEIDGTDGTMTGSQIVEGQAESYEKVVNDDGTATYTFKLRDDIKWSDGQDVKASDFVYAWQRLVNPETACDYSYMLDCVVNAQDIIDGNKPATELAVEAPDDKTFIVTLTSDITHFLELCAFPAMLPVRQDVIEANGDQWTFNPETYITNGAYKMQAWNHNAEIIMEKNDQYYDVANLGPDTITFKLMDDANAMLSGFNSGELDFIEEVPQAEVTNLIASGDLKIVDYIGTYYACYQTQKAPFDDARVRKAFTLAVDRTYIVEKVTQAGQIEAGGFVPSGVYDAQGAEGDDFRTIGGSFYGETDADYKANCEEARKLLAEAGYPDGKGFPVVEYLYNTNDEHKAIAEALQYMWETELGVKVTLNNQEWAVFLQTRKDGDYSIARNGWIADYNDPMSFLDMWLTGGGNNDAQYTSKKYDELIGKAKASSTQEDRMKYMHEAEAQIIGEDWALNPLYFYTQKYMLNPELKGVYYTPLGYFFFGYSSK